MSLTAPQIFDIVVLAVIVMAAILGAIKGFFKSCIGIVVIAASIFIGYKVSPLVTPKAVEWVYPRISDKLLAYATKRGIDFSSLTQEQTDSLLKSLMTPAAKIVCWIIIAIVLMFVLGFLGTLISKAIENAPAIKGADALLGGVLGAVMAFLVCYLFVFAFAKAGMGEYFAGKLDGSIAYRILYSCVPKAAGSIGINLPGIGEINLRDFFRNDSAQ